VGSAAKSTRPTRPAPDPNFDPEGQPDPPQFAALRGQPDPTRFTHWGGGFNPIQPVNPNLKISPFSNCRFFPIFFLLLQYYRSLCIGRQKVCSVCLSLPRAFLSSKNNFIQAINTVVEKGAKIQSS
jgi:hypothetical protein